MAEDFTFVAEALAAHAVGISDATAQELLRALGMEDAQRPEEFRAVADAVAMHDEDPASADEVLRAMGTQYDVVASALAAHVADVADEDSLEVAADALVRNLMSDAMTQNLKDRIQSPSVAEDMDTFDIDALQDDMKSVAKALLCHAAFASATFEELSKGFSMRGEATPFRVSSSPAKLVRLHSALRSELMDAIRASDPVRMRAAVNRGASLSAHYYSARMRPRHYGSEHSSKGPKASLVNPVDWAVLEGFYKEAVFLMELTDGHMAFNRDEERSSLQVVRMAERCRQAVVVASSRGQVNLLRELLQRGADCAQRDPSGCTALHLAVRSGEEEAAALLLERGAWGLEDQKEDVLRHAEAQRVKCVIEAAGLAARNENVLDPKLPHYQEVIEVLAEVKEEDRNLTWAEISMRSRLAARARPSTLPGYVPEAMEGLSWGPLPTVEEARREQKELLGLLSKAIRKNDAIGVRALIQRGAPMEVVFDLGYGEVGNCVDLAVSCEKPDMALTLLDIADAREIGEALAQNSVPALFWSVLRGYSDVLEGLLCRGMDVAAQRKTVSNESALALSVGSARWEEARLLLRYGAWEREPAAQRCELMKKVRMQGKQMIQIFVAEGAGGF